MPQNLLEQLRKYTTVVADTGDIEAMEKFRPTDATTNPSLITAAAQMPQYQPIVDSVHHGRAARNWAKTRATRTWPTSLSSGLAVAFGKKILAIVPGRVSTEVDARLSYDTEATIAQARSIIAQYDKAGIGRDHVLIKIASTWEGIQAARGAGERRHPLQPDAALRHAPGRRLRRSRRNAGLAVRGPHSRLVQEGHRARTTRAPTIRACSR